MGSPILIEANISSVAGGTGIKIAVVGAGPACLSCAYFLRRLGHHPVIFEAMPRLGGMLRYGIPEYRLPKKIVDRDIEGILELGVEYNCRFEITRNQTLAAEEDTLQTAVPQVFTAGDMHTGGASVIKAIGGRPVLRDPSIITSPKAGFRFLRICGATLFRYQGGQRRHYGRAGVIGSQPLFTVWIDLL